MTWMSLSLKKSVSSRPTSSLDKYTTVFSANCDTNVKDELSNLLQRKTSLSTIPKYKGGFTGARAVAVKFVGREEVALVLILGFTTLNDRARLLEADAEAPVDDSTG
jgi:hypothetical protein